MKTRKERQADICMHIARWLAIVELANMFLLPYVFYAFKSNKSLSFLCSLCNIVHFSFFKHFFRGPDPSYQQSSVSAQHLYSWSKNLFGFLLKAAFISINM